MNQGAERYIKEEKKILRISGTTGHYDGPCFFSSHDRIILAGPVAERSISFYNRNIHNQEESYHTPGGIKLKKDERGPRVLGLVLALFMLLALAGVASADDRYEENDDKDTAAEVNYGNYTGLSAEDDDWYKISLNDGADISVTIRFDGDEADLDLYLYNEDDEELDYSDGTGNTEKVEATDLDAGWYYIEVYLLDGETSYDMMISDEVEEPEDDKYEENDDKDEAAEVDYGLYEDLYCGDDDWYRISLDDGDDLVVTIRFDGDEIDLDLYLYDEDDNELAASEGVDDDEQVSAVDVEEGWYYIKVISFNGKGSYEMEIDDEFEAPEGIINVEQRVYDGDDDGRMNDCNFYAHVKGDNVPGVNITIYDNWGSEVATGTTDGGGEWTLPNMTNGDYSWDAEYQGETLDDEGTFDVAVGVREVQAFAVVMDYSFDGKYNDVAFVAYDDEEGGVGGVECEISWADNGSFYAQGRTNNNGEYIEEDLPEDNFTFTMSYEDETFNTGWFHSYGGGSGSGETDEWFADWDYKTRDTGTDRRDDTIDISYDPDTEAVEMDVEVDVNVYLDDEWYDSFWDEHTINGTDEDWFTQSWTADQEGYYDFEVYLYDDEYYLEDNFTIEDVHLYAAQGMEKTTLEGFITEGDSRGEGDPIEDAEVILTGNNTYRTYTDEEGYYKMDCDQDNYTIEIKHKDYEKHEDEIWVKPGKNWYNETLTPKEWGRFFGKITDKESGDPMEDVKVTLRNKDDGKDYINYTESDGSFSLTVEAGDYDITIRYTDYEQIEDEVTIEKDDEIERDYEMEKEVREGEVWGTVKDDAANKGIEDVTLTFTGKESRNGESYDTSTDEYGDYDIDLPEGDYYVTVEHDDYKTIESEVTVVGDGSVERNYRMDPKDGKIHGEVTDKETDDPIKDAVVTAEEKEGRGDPYTNDTTTDRDGEYEMNLPPGEYQITVEHDDYITFWDNITVEKEDDKRLDYELEPRPREGTVHGTITDKDGGAAMEGVEVVLESTGGRGETYSDTTDVDGEYSLTVPEGDYDITVSFDGYEDIEDTVTVEDKGDEEKNYEMEKLPDNKLKIDTDAPDEMDAGDELRITITVTDLDSSDPVEEADLDISHTGPADMAVSPGAMETNANGEYVIVVTADEVSVASEITIDITAEKDGYQSDTLQLKISINPSTKKVVGPEEGDLDNGATYSVTAGIEGDGELTVDAISSPDPEDDKNIGIFMDIEFDGLDEELEWVYIVIYYDEVPEGISENKLKIYYWDEDADEWVEAEDTGVDTVNQYVWANVTHLTTFAPRDVTGSVVKNYGVTLTGEEAKTVKAGEETTYSLTITNTGDVTTTYKIEIIGTDEDKNEEWGSLEIEEVTLDVGQAETFSVTVAVPDSVPDGSYGLLVMATSTTDPSNTVSYGLFLTVTVESDGGGGGGGGGGGDDDSPGFALGILVASLVMVAIRRKRR